MTNLNNKSIDNIDNKDYLNIDNNIDNGKYSLKDSFNPSTEDSYTAKEIGRAFNDLKNYAFYYKSVQIIGPQKAMQLLSETKNDIRLGKEKGKLIRNPAALYNWKVNDYLKNKKI